MSNIAKNIGERLRAYRLKNNLSQEALAEKANLHYTYIGQVERGEKNATLESIERIANALDVSLSSLFENLNYSNNEFNYPAQAYDIILSLPEDKQIEILDIIKKTIEFSN